MNFDERMEALRINIESLHSNVAQLFEITARDGDHIRDLAKIAQAQNDGIDKLLRIAVAHEHRLDSIDGGASAQ